ncbi:MULTISPECIES: ketoacyl-ACP synthase III family protein [Streptomyces]|uniref:3-oxoacyl-ACP synthase n=2 Tax=Streptomyces TaxID=1883 RepID=A0A3M8F801_9ACTN|nr:MULTISPECIES: ketoacyl-ACP synthase III family protein [Streptomyces]KNE82219.1 3-oxoacyl-ACP synthase [Streptomyces fradiae]MCC5033273.1 ketoacyl-ACP synthase III family protein [Streptomyces sp. WAC 00631]MCC9741367.1 ketoacyl-ACP synthase III family protein [Streptomyces sp. MNU89]OFA56478.1 3-oxoacyl-ACP synthase [Streptomyces fradiae]PQM22810.1 3-oxoacyl-ACP synthase [Streptomyces xinghaiensis]
MRVENVFIRGTGIRLPGSLRVADAVAAGDCPARLASATGVLSVSHSADESAAEMAVAAARSALRRAGSSPGDIDLILHADTYHQGQDLWPVASYIQRETTGNSCPAIEIRQMSNGGMAALDLATAYLTAAPHRCDALLTTADRFCEPGIDRWRTDPGTPYADGGTALVLSRRGGYARLVSLAVLADSELEPMHRGDDPFGKAPFSHRIPVDFEEAKRAFTARAGMSYAITRANAGQRSVVKQALADAGMELADADWVVLPHFGRRRLSTIYYGPYGIDPARTTWEWSRTVGHLGAGDQFAGLDYLVGSGSAVPGDRCVLIGVGAGYSWGCAVVDILDRPDWA